MPANPNLPIAGGTILTALTIEGLAEKLGSPAPTVVRTVAEYNEAVKSDSTGQLAPSRSVRKFKAFPIQQPPYHAVRVLPGITYTMGGIAIDEFGRVLRKGGEPIPGLYASGCATGGLDGGTAAAYVGGLARSAVISLRLAAHVAEHSATKIARAQLS